MDRFIVNRMDDGIYNNSDLKSNMDRFIAGTYTDLQDKYAFKIQYGQIYRNVLSFCKLPVSKFKIQYGQIYRTPKA